MFDRFTAWLLGCFSDWLYRGIDISFDLEDEE